MVRRAAPSTFCRSLLGVRTFCAENSTINADQETKDVASFIGLDESVREFLLDNCHCKFTRDVVLSKVGRLLFWPESTESFVKITLP